MCCTVDLNLLPIIKRSSHLLQDLVRAAQKTVASGMGDWHLQPVEYASPLFQQRMLLGALGPETLKTRHGLEEKQALLLYGCMHRHCIAFQQEVGEACQGAKFKEQLLVNVWRAYAQLWDETVQVSPVCNIVWAGVEVNYAHQYVTCLLQCFQLSLCTTKQSLRPDLAPHRQIHTQT